MIFLQDPEIRPLVEQTSEYLQKLLPEIPIWIKNPDIDRVSSIFTMNFDKLINLQVTLFCAD